MVIPASSTEYLHVPVTAPAGTDLAEAPVMIAVVAHGDNPSDDEWHTAEWVEGVARLLIGPDGGALTLTPRNYRVWITFDPPGAENIVRLAGSLTIN
ncbi:hypothetical protein [Streptomyces sp. STCH 565 A]|uniref:hypothetical protein n=1 Tax=Streptomyces sp. STCH 565 A TaxID=2950532 RepID=UPI002074CD39|nr:hypothetical protein [Streptomyces sp. STCH 565 A]MCM8552314.1 hypothetical protein [Streptomyces sp. STCH 565 A]